MGQVLHGCARTTEAVRREIQNSKESVKALSERLGLNCKTVLKWKNRDFVHDMPMGPKNPHSTVLTREEEAICVAFRKHSLLPLDDCLFTLRETIPRLSRSSLHRLFQRNGISKLPENEEKKPKKKFKKYLIGYFHIDITEVRTEEGKLHLFVAVDRTSKFAHVELSEKQGEIQAADPYKIRSIQVDGGSEFMLEVENACAELNIPLFVNPPATPKNNGGVERGNKTFREEFYANHDLLADTITSMRSALQLAVRKYNDYRPHASLNGLTPSLYIRNCSEAIPSHLG